MKSNRGPAQGAATVPSDRDLENEIVKRFLSVLHERPEHKQICQQTGLSDDAVDERVLSDGVQQRLVMGVVAHLLERLPEVMAKLVDLAVQGNASAAKVVLDLAGVGEQTKTMLGFSESTAQDAVLSPLDLGVLENIREQIARMPDAPDPLTEP